MNGNDHSVMTIREVSEYLRIPVSTIYYLANKRKLRGAKVGKHWRFLKEEIMNYLREGNAYVPS